MNIDLFDKTITVEPAPGAYSEDVFREVIDLAGQLDAEVKFKFNGIEQVANKNTTIEELRFPFQQSNRDLKEPNKLISFVNDLPPEQQFKCLKEIQERLHVIEHLADINVECEPNLMDIKHSILHIRIELMKLAPAIHWGPTKEQINIKKEN